MFNQCSPFVRFIKEAYRLQCEWLADAAAVQFTRNPNGIEGAFKKIGGLLKQGTASTRLTQKVQAIFIFPIRLYEPWFGFMSTHPPLPKRILAIDPAFDSRFA